MKMDIRCGKMLLLLSKEYSSIIDENRLSVQLLQEFATFALWRVVHPGLASLYLLAL